MCSPYVWRSVIRLTGVALVFAASRNANAAVVTYIGQVNNIGASAALIYGTDGYDLYGTSPAGTTSGSLGGTRLSSLPAYVGGVNFDNASLTASGYGYASIKNPAGGIVESGALFGQSGTAATQVDLLTVTITGSVPSAFIVGVVTNIDASASDFVDQLRLRQVAGGTADGGLVSTSKIPDAGIDESFFRISNAQPGDAFTLSGTESVANNGSYHVVTAGLTFTRNAVPEPTSATVVALAGVGLIGRRRFQNTNRNTTI